MKAKLMSILDTNEPSKQLYGVKITGLKRSIFLMQNDGFYETTNKTECVKMVKETNKYLNDNTEIETQLRENKDIMGIKI